MKNDWQTGPFFFSAKLNISNNLCKFGECACKKKKKKKKHYAKRD